MGSFDQISLKQKISCQCTFKAYFSCVYRKNLSRRGYYYHQVIKEFKVNIDTPRTLGHPGHHQQSWKLIQCSRLQSRSYRRIYKFKKSIDLRVQNSHVIVPLLGEMVSKNKQAIASLQRMLRGLRGKLSLQSFSFKIVPKSCKCGWNSLIKQNMQIKRQNTSSWLSEHKYIRRGANAFNIS